MPVDFMDESFSILGDEEEKMKPNRVLSKKLLAANKFYVGSPSALVKNWGHPTLAKAVKHAEELTDSTNEEHFIVQIIRVVKYKKQPVIVEKV